jgi:hypothetical protein
MKKNKGFRDFYNDDDNYGRGKKKTPDWKKNRKDKSSDRFRELERDDD